MPLPDTSLRSSKAVPLAALMTAGLLILMTVLIAIDENPVTDDSPPMTINIFEGDIDDTENITKRKLPEPIRPKTKPAPEIAIHQEPEPAIRPDVKRDTPFNQKTNFLAGPDGKSSIDGLALGSGDQVAMIDKRPPPKYPSGALQKELEGYVDLSFDITPKGTTTNIRVIDAWPRRVFDKSAIQALKKWRYKPQRVDGEPVNVSGATTRIIFTLDKP